MIDADEIMRGLVLFLDPRVLRDAGATHTRPVDLAGLNPHYLMCTQVVGDESTWAPLSSKDGPGRIRIASKCGRPEWVWRSTFRVPGQSWRASVSSLPGVVPRSNDAREPQLRVPERANRPRACRLKTHVRRRPWWTPELPLAREDRGVPPTG